MLAPTPQEVLAANLRRLRIARRLSLSELARATGMSKATLSSVESGRSNPTIETLAALAAALRVSLAELLEEPPLGEVRIVRRLDRIEEEGVGLSARTWEPRQLEEPEPAPAGARAGVYVLEGKLIAGPVERVTELSTGDYASFPIDVPYVYETGRAAARALILTYGAPGALRG
jgi:transcriptional regulator with XRE-family HTH domain